jgi:hypothetical protein
VTPPVPEEQQLQVYVVLLVEGHPMVKKQNQTLASMSGLEALQEEEVLPEV